jgi:serine/threonine protein phosphatase PrpC
MGCGASTLPVRDASSALTSQVASNGNTSGSNKIESTFYVQTINYKSPMIRLDHIEEPKIIRVRGQTLEMDLKYVYVSQRGFYPSDPAKANQDCYCICESLLGDHSTNLFGIFDGHGTYGDLCAYYAADEVPKNLVRQLNKSGGLSSLEGAKKDDVYAKAFTDTDKALHTTPYIDDSLSGTTAVTVLQQGDRLHVANVGDSRAIIASMVHGKLMYSPLSNDQTPYRKDERERLKKLVGILFPLSLMTF